MSHYRTTSAILHHDSSVKNCADLPRWEVAVWVKVRHVRVSPAAFIRHLRTIVSCDLKKIDLKKKRQRTASIVGEV